MDARNLAIGGDSVAETAMREKIINKDKTPTWIVNPDGIVSCLPRHVAKEFVETKIGWRFASDEEKEGVPVKKEYPLDPGLKPEAYKMRVEMKENTEKVESKKEGDIANEKDGKVETKTLRIVAKEAGISKYWLKSDKRLKQELSEIK